MLTSKGRRGRAWAGLGDNCALKYGQITSVMDGKSPRDRDGELLALAEFAEMLNPLGFHVYGGADRDDTTEQHGWLQEADGSVAP